MINIKRINIVLGAWILSLSTLALTINSNYYHFQMNNYFPYECSSISILLFFIYLGIRIHFGVNSKQLLAVKECINLFLVMSIIAIATNAVQCTPFSPIDLYIIKLEKLLSVDLIPMMQWLNNYPTLKHIFELIYDSLPIQMSIIPLFIIATGGLYRIQKYYFLLLVSTLIGFSFYYFFPTTAPASMFHSPLFTEDQLATGLKFSQIHHFEIPTTNSGGLISMPSFHAIWAVLCVYLIKDWAILFYGLSTFNLLLILSCVLLGWHYPLDIVGSFFIIQCSLFWLRNYSTDPLLRNHINLSTDRY